MRFEWDEPKRKKNLKKHEITFEEAKTVFLDPMARLVDDPDHSKEEERFVLIGMSEKLNILVVCHCYRQSDEVIRIISARKADRGERKQYERYL
jgi:uncharacterized DUF497 family protein